MKDIKNFTKKIIDRHFETYSDIDKGFIFLISILNILKNDRFLNEYQSLYIYPNNNELKLFFNCESRNNEFISINTKDDISDMPVFLPNNIYNSLSLFKSIIDGSQNEEQYNKSINEMFLYNPDIINVIRENRTVFNQNYLSEEDYIFKKTLLNIDKENPFSFGFKPKIKPIDLSKVKNNLFNKKILPLITLEEKYKHEIKKILKEVNTNFPELFIYKNEIINNSYIEHIKLEQNNVENDYSHIKSELIATPYNIENSIPLHIKGLNFLNSAFALHNGKKNSHFIFLKSKDGELLGGISYSNKEGSMINEIGFSFTNRSYRGCGVASKLYDKLAQECITDKKVLFNLFYTEDGELAIPKIKNKLKEKYKNIFIVDLDHKNDSEELNRAISNFNYEFKELILDIDKIEKKDDNLLFRIKNHYEKMLPFIKNNILSSDDEREFIKVNISKLKNNIKNKISLSGKNYLFNKKRL